MIIAQPFLTLIPALGGESDVPLQPMTRDLPQKSFCHLTASHSTTQAGHVHRNVHISDLICYHSYDSLLQAQGSKYWPCHVARLH